MRDRPEFTIIAATKCCGQVAAAHMERDPGEAERFAADEMNAGFVVSRIKSDDLTPERWVDDWPHTCPSEEGS